MAYYNIIILVGQLAICLTGLNIILFDALLIWWLIKRRELEGYKHRERTVKAIVNEEMQSYDMMVHKIREIVGSE